MDVRTISPFYRMRLAIVVVTAVFASMGAAQAQSAPEGAGGQSNFGGTAQTSGQQAASADSPSIQSSLGPYGDLGGVRAALARHGITYSLTYIGEVFGDLSGGSRTGGIHEGRLDAEINVDLKTALGIEGGTLYAEGYRIYGDGLSRNDVLDLSTTSSIEARASTRLYAAWYEQTLPGGKAALRLGQFGADTEFFVSQYAGIFVNSTFGFPNITAYDLPSGGPAYPLAVPGARLKLTPDQHWSLLGAVFDGDPAGPAAAGANPDPQRRDPHGTNFRVTDAPLVFLEAQYAYGDKEGPVLLGIAKLGGWRHFGRFVPESLAYSAAQSAPAPSLGGNDGIYGMVDQMVYRLPNTEDGAIGAFARLSAAPSDRNLVSFYADGGVTAKGLVPGRPDDSAGLSSAYTQISSKARQADFSQKLTAPGYPARSNEILVEATYQAQVVPGFTVQPDVQYVMRPGGHIPNPNDPSGRPIHNAVVFGVRATIQY